MNCQEAERLVMPYIQDELNDQELEAFLEHVQHCENCQEELEIYFTVALGLQQLDEDSGNFNIKGEMEHVMEESKQRVAFARIFTITRYAVSTLAWTGLILTLLLQLRIWLQTGFL